MSYKFLPLSVTFSAEISYASYQLRSTFFSGRLNLSVQPFLSYQSMSKCCLGNLSRSTFCVFRFTSRWFKFKPSELSCTYSLKRYMLWDMTGWSLHPLFVYMEYGYEKIYSNPEKSFGFPDLSWMWYLEECFFLSLPLQALNALGGFVGKQPLSGCLIR